MQRFSIERSDENLAYHAHVHAGAGTLGVRFFDFGGAPAPARFLIYEIPPGASEGMHAHGADEAGRAYEEYYYILAGSGRMMIDGKAVAVATGDHIHVPLDIPHDIMNDGGQLLRVFLTYIERSGTGSVP